MDECNYQGHFCPFSNMTCKLCPFSQSFRDYFSYRNKIRVDYSTIEWFEIIKGQCLVSPYYSFKSLGLKPNDF